MFDLKEYIEENMDFREQQSNPEQLSINCIHPDCEDSYRQKKKMTVNTEKKQAFCYLCGVAYHNSVEFVAEYEGISKLAAVRLVKNDGPRIVHEPERLVKAMSKLEETAEEEEDEKPKLKLPHCINIEEGSPAYLYLKDRDFDGTIIDNFVLRFIPKPCDPWQYQNRIMIPIYDGEGNLKSFQARSILDGVKPKYIFPTDGAHQNMLYNWHDAKCFETLILVEGVTDCWRMWLRGYQNTTATFGKTLKTEQRRLIIGNSRTEKVIFFYDGEGKANAWKAAEKLADFKKVFVAELPVDMEPDNCPDPGKYFTSAIRFKDLSPLERKVRCL